MWCVGQSERLAQAARCYSLSLKQEELLCCKQQSERRRKVKEAQSKWKLEFEHLQELLIIVTRMRKQLKQQQQQQQQQQKASTNPSMTALPPALCSTSSNTNTDTDTSTGTGSNDATQGLVATTATSRTISHHRVEFTRGLLATAESNAALHLLANLLLTTSAACTGLSADAGACTAPCARGRSGGGRGRGGEARTHHHVVVVRGYGTRDESPVPDLIRRLVREDAPAALLVKAKAKDLGIGPGLAPFSDGELMGLGRALFVVRHLKSRGVLPVMLRPEVGQLGAGLRAVLFEFRVTSVR